MACIKTQYDHEGKLITVAVNEQTRVRIRYDESLTGAENHDNAFRDTAKSYGYWGKFYRSAVFGGYIYIEADDAVEVEV